MKIAHKFSKAIFVVIALLITTSASTSAYNITIQVSSSIALSTVGTSPATPQGPCAGFSDVTTHYYGCVALDYLFSKGWISGYNNPDCANNGVSEPCFLPYNEVTRGQFSKILVNTYQWPINTTGGPHFSDVPILYVFYPYIETAYNMGIISGYVDPICSGNGVASPCFLPSNPITRGQMSKMVSNASGFNDNTSGRTPSFYDVPSSDTFFTYIERLIMHAVVSQYPPQHPSPPICGSAAQPCFFPYNKAPRIDAVVHVSIGSGRQNNAGLAQVFALKGGPNPTYDGVWVYMTTPDPPLFSGQDIGGPVGASDRYGDHYIESGPEKRCNVFCGLHPFGTWGNVDSSDYLFETSINLGAGLTYAYKSVHFGGSGGQWQSQFCSTGCQGLVTSQDLGSALPFAATGGESTQMSVSFGSITASLAQYHSGGTWILACYDPAQTPWRTLNGSISPCNNYSWKLSY